MIKTNIFQLMVVGQTGKKQVTVLYLVEEVLKYGQESATTQNQLFLEPIARDLKLKTAPAIQHPAQVSLKFSGEFPIVC
jgi:hypothetical protein